MTRDDAVEILTTAREMYPGKSVIRDAFTLALSALRPVSREQVERMAGEWVQDINKGPAVFYCSSCGESFEIHSYEFQKYRFCPFCMAPMTDEAVEMVMERLEALKDGKGD
ncbi:hypothetical protein LAWASA_3485 [Lawsonibacter asaccharolyticus]|nr:hypothetical protein LAWASA_3485 [Lawsonibacter asaccharolyticus]